MRYLLTIILLFGITFGQKIITMTETEDSNKKIEIKKEITDDKISVTIIKDGETETLTADADDKQALEKINQKLAEYDSENKIVLHKNYNKHDCKKIGCDPGECKHAEKRCDKNLVIKMKDGTFDEDAERMVRFHKPLIETKPSGYLGVHIQNLTEQLAAYFKVTDGVGVLITEVEKDSPAEKAGLKAGDIITKVEDQEVASTAELSEAVKSYDPETKIAVSVLRDGKSKKFNATLAESEMNMFMAHHGFEVPDIEKFNFHDFKFDEEELKAHLKELDKELEVLKKELQELRDKK